MKNKISLQDTKTTRNQTINPPVWEDYTSSDLINLNGISKMLTSEGNESFKNYIEWLGLAKDPKLVVLSSVHHYYYDAEELKNIKTVVNLKELNQIKDINSLIHSMFLILPSRCYFLGCFSDSRKQSLFSFRGKNSVRDSEKQSEEVKNGIVSRIPILNTIFTFLDAKTNKYLSGNQVAILLENNGFKVIDMTELDGLTYFCAQSQRKLDN